MWQSGAARKTSPYDVIYVRKWLTSETKFAPASALVNQYVVNMVNFSALL